MNWYGYYKCSDEAQESLGMWMDQTQNQVVATGTNLAMPAITEQVQGQLYARN